MPRRRTLLQMTRAENGSAESRDEAVNQCFAPVLSGGVSLSMHTYLESIGFKRITGHRELERLNRDTVLNFDRRSLFKNDSGRVYGAFSKNYAAEIGITVCGEFDENGDFHPEYSLPFFTGATVSMNQSVDFEKHAGEESYAGACEDPRIGATVIFYLLNMGEYKAAVTEAPLSLDPRSIRLSALAREGTILLPVYQSESDEQQGIKARERQIKLISDARGGDEEAIDALTAEDMKDYSIISKRIQNEDVFSIVETCFLPYGIECDQYSICANILSCTPVRNLYTNELMYQMQVETCDVKLDVCINADSLEGVPKAGRRFRGLIWLQGSVDFG